MYLLPNICFLGTLLLTISSEAQLKINLPVVGPILDLCKVLKEVGEVINPLNIISLRQCCDNLHCEENIVSLKCPDGFTKILNNCFKTINKELNWEEAKNECEDIGGSLAIINDCNLLRPVSKFLSDSSPKSTIIWIGASKKEEGQFTWVDGTNVQMGVPFWGTYVGSILAPYFENVNCAKMDPNKQYYFYESNCTNLGTPLCQAEPLSVKKNKKCVCNDDAVKTKCPEGFEDVGGSCFYFPANISDSTELTSFDEGRDVCQRFYPNSDLPILDSCNLFTELVDFINKIEKYHTRTYSYWVNAKRSEGRLYIWGNGKELEPGNPFWGEGTFGELQPTLSPNEDCAIMYGANQYYFHDIFCDNNYRVSFPLCQADPIPQE